MRHAEDPLLAADRIVRLGLGVRDGQTIHARAWEIAYANTWSYAIDTQILAAATAIIP